MDYDIPTLLPSQPKAPPKPKALYFQAIKGNVQFKVTSGGIFAKTEGEEQACVQVDKRTIHFWEHAGWVHICFIERMVAAGLPEGGQ